jgi:hypothetical protein
MEAEFKITRVSRQLYNSFFEKYTLEQLNKVPQGFSNNIIWNIGHIVVAQQMLVYLASGKQPMISAELIELYKRGTRPEKDVTQAEADEIKNLLFTTIEKTEQDYKEGLFTGIAYPERKTEFGFVLSSIDDAIAFNNYHEGVHLGVIMGLRKFV